jgi:hypothetical protein
LRRRAVTLGGLATATHTSFCIDKTLSDIADGGRNCPGLGPERGLNQAGGKQIGLLEEYCVGEGHALSDFRACYLLARYCDVFYGDTADYGLGSLRRSSSAS